MVQPASDTTAALHARVDINEFVLQHRRLPRIDDEIPPWDYRGWLLWHCQLAHWHPEVVNRWDYYQRTLEAGRLLDEQIPRITFSDGGSNEAVRILQRALDLIFGELGSWAAFPVLVDWIAWGMAVSSERPHFSAKLNEALYRHFDLGPLLLCPHDYLGALYPIRLAGAPERDAVSDARGLFDRCTCSRR